MNNIKLNKGVITKTQEVYRAGVYNSLMNWSFTKNGNCIVIDILKQQLAKFNSRDLIFVSGNFNNRLGTWFYNFEYSRKKRKDGPRNPRPMLKFSMGPIILHRVKSIRIRSYSGPYFPAFGPSTEK